jgi:MscS family membrane protein
VLKYGWFFIGILMVPCIAAKTAAEEDTTDIPVNMTTPRKTLESFCFAAEAIKRNVKGSMIAALTMIDIPETVQPDEQRKLVGMLVEILDILSPPFVSADATNNGKVSHLWAQGQHRLSFSKGDDGIWKFDRATAIGLPALHEESIKIWNSREKQITQMEDNLGHATELFNTFFNRLLAEDYEAAAQCLDLRDIPSEQRRTEGKRLAWMLGLSIQRLGFVFPQDIPVDASRPPYLWYAGLEGFVVSERIKVDEKPDRWAFNALSVQQIPKLYEIVKDRPIDIRWKIVKSVIKSLRDLGDQTAPEGLPKDYSSPRHVLRAFLRSIDDAEHDDSHMETAASMLDLSHLPPDEAQRQGPRLAEKLEVLLRKMKPILAEIDDRWTSAPVTLGDKTLKIQLSKRSDGRWCFNRDSVVRISSIYDSLTASERGPTELSAGRSSPRETFVTFLRAMNEKRTVAAAACLDLSEIPVSARSNLGPVLASKLKLVVDRIGRVYFHEIPSEAEGPRYLWHRGPLGRIILSRRADQLDAGWRFSETTVRNLDSAIDLMQEMKVADDLEHPFLRVPSFKSTPGLWIRWHMPEALRTRYFELSLWQWLGIPTMIGVLILFFRLQQWLFDPLAARFAGSITDHDLKKLRLNLIGFRIFIVVIVTYLLLPFLDLPIGLASTLYTFDKFLLAAVVIWAGIGLSDFIRAVSARHGSATRRKGFQDLIIPFVTRLFKIVLIITAMIYLISCFDEGALLGRFLAGLGVDGLAVSLAAQDSLKNLFATMLLFADKSFAVGDKVVIGTHEGTVEGVGFRSTRLRTKEDSILIIPNATVAGGNINNQAMRVYQRVMTQVFLDPESPPATLMELQKQTHDMLAARPNIEESRLEVGLHGISEKGVELRVVTYMRGKSNQARELRSELTLAILEKAQSLGLKIVIHS